MPDPIALPGANPSGDIVLPTWLAGWKTYLCVIGGVIVTVLHQLGYIDENTMTTINSLLGFGGLAALRSGVKKAATTQINATVAVGQQLQAGKSVG